MLILGITHLNKHMKDGKYYKNMCKKHFINIKLSVINPKI